MPARPGRGRLAAGLAATVFLAASLAAWAPARADEAPTAGAADLPFARGDRIAESWVVSAVDRHPEFVRLSLVEGVGGTKTVVEVTVGRGDSDSWSTAHYRVQPAPGQSPPEAVLLDVLRRLEAAAHAAGPEPFVRRLRTTSTGGEVAPDAVRRRWSVLGVAALLVAATLVFVWSGRSRRARSVLEPLGRKAFRPWAEAIDGLARHLPFPLAQARPSVDVLLALLVAGAACALLVVSAGPVPLGLDTVGDFARARDCVEGACRLEGPSSSFWNLRHGPLWVLVLTACRYLGLGPAGAFWVAAALHATAAGVVVLAISRPFGRAVALLAALAGVWLAAGMAEFPKLWTPTPAPLPLALWVLASLAFVRNGRLRWAVLSGAALALSADSHVVNLGLVPFFVGLLGIAGRRPAAAIAAGVVGLASVILFVSRDAHAANLGRLADHGLLVPVAGVLVLACGVGLLLRRPFREARHPSLHFLAAGSLHAAALLWAVGLAAPVHFYYALLLVPLVLPLAAALVLRVAARLGEACWGVAGGRRAAWAACLAGLALFSGLVAHCPLVRAQSSWSLNDAEVVAGALFRQGYAYRDLVRRLQGPGQVELLSGIGLFAPSSPSPAEPLEDGLFVELRRTGEAADAGPGTEVIDLDSGRRVVLRRLPAWVVRDRFTACYLAGGSRDCVQTGFDDETVERWGPDATRQQITFMPMRGPMEVRRTVVRRARGDVVLEYTFQVLAGPPGERRDVETVAPWRITAVSGLDVRGALPSARASLERRPGSGRGTITVSLRMDEGRLFLDEGFPPAVIERPVPGSCTAPAD